MSAHERERLSAYLDGELAPEERHAVEAHLEACPECRVRLAELGAVDEAARALSAEAPAGYFDAFAARVRARIEAHAPRRARAGGSHGRLPVWTWAAAAVLLLAVVTPLTLRQALREGAPAAQAPRDAPSAQTAPATLGPGTPTPPAAPLRNESVRDERGEVAPSVEPEPKEEERVPLAAASRVGEAPAAQKRSAGGFAAAPPPAPGAVMAGAGAPAPSREAREDTARSLATSDEDTATAGAAAPMPEAQAAGQPAEPRERRQGPTGLEKAAVLSADEATYRRLSREQPADAAGWREIREAWRAFAEEHSDSRHADEARVRVIEAGVAAWRAGGDEADLARARADLAAYLDRSDARLAERARRAFEPAERR